MRRDEEVLGLADDLSIGPIATADIKARMKWSERELRFHNSAESRGHFERFWKRITAQRNEIIAWMSTRCATEYCGLLELLWRVKVPVSVIDVASAKIVDKDGSRIPICLDGLRICESRPRHHEQAHRSRD
jgi:hypothetical protein